MPRRPKNLRPDLSGLLVIDKPAGMTSFAVCREVRRRTAGAKIGHAGTLDPFASGVLVLAVGAATKQIAALMATDKRYTAVLDLSRRSTTDDPEGEIEYFPVLTPPTLATIDSALASFVGEIEQRPPIYSAVHISGERAYRLARRGTLTERPAPRPVVIHSIDIISYDWPELALDVRCGKGVYIRSLARDLGGSLGVGGMLTALRRTAVGEFTLDRATPLANLPDPAEQAILPINGRTSETDPRKP